MAGVVSAAYAVYPLLLWVLASVVLYGLVTNLLYLVRGAGWRQASYSSGLVQIGRLFFFVGIPYLALGGWPRRPFQGLLSLQDIGLVGFGGDWPLDRWLEAAGTGFALGLLAFLVLGLAWANANRDGAVLRFSHRPWWLLLADVVFFQVHWAFYRGALAVTADSISAGVFWGLGFVYLEWSTNPFWRRGWRKRTQAAELWLQAAMALVMALIFFLTRNLWVCFGVHLVLVWAFHQFGRKPATGRDTRTIPLW